MFLPDDLDIDVDLSYTWKFIDYDDYLGPDKYLQDAIDDLKSGQERRHYNNAIRNAKSALHMKVDILCKVFAGDKYFSKCLKYFPQKMDFLESIGIVRPRIIDRINKIRNKIEHEYIDATSTEAEDFIDIVLLFIEATRYLNSRFPSNIDLYTSVHIKNLYLKRILCNFSLGELIFDVSESDCFDYNNIQKIIIRVGDKKYNEWVKYIVKNNE